MRVYNEGKESCEELKQPLLYNLYHNSAVGGGHSYLLGTEYLRDYIQKLYEYRETRDSWISVH